MSESSEAKSNLPQILHLTTAEIKDALIESKQINKKFNTQLNPELSAKQKKALNKIVKSINTTKKHLKELGSEFIEIDDQESGNLIKVNSVLLPKPGFAVIEKTNRKAIGSSSLLNEGVTQNIIIELSEVVDGETLFIRLYRDNGDRIFNPKTDKWLRYENGMRIQRRIDVNSKRNLTHNYYSNYLSKGVPSLVMKEQLPGNKITISSIYYGLTKDDHFIVVRKSLNDFPDRIIGISNVSKYCASNCNITLKEFVSNEILFAMIYNDNGDRLFDENHDLPLRGVNNLPIIIEFPVIK